MDTNSKILIFILFVLVFIALFGSGYASSQNRSTNDQVTELETEVDELNTVTAGLTTEVGQLETNTKYITSSTLGTTMTGSLYISNTSVIDVGNTLTKQTYSSSTNTQTFDCNVTLNSGDILTVNSKDVGNVLTKQSYKSSEDNQGFDCNVTVTKTLTVTNPNTNTGGLIDVGYSIDNLNNVINEGLYSVSSLILDTLTVNQSSNLKGTTTIDSLIINQSTILNGTTTTDTLKANSLNGISSTTISYLDATSSIQGQLNSKASTLNDNSWSGLNSFSQTVTVGSSSVDPVNGIVSPTVTTTTIVSNSTETGTVIRYDSPNNSGVITTYSNPILNELSNVKLGPQIGIQFMNVISAILYVYHDDDGSVNQQNYVLTCSQARIPYPYSGYDFIWILSPGYSFLFYRENYYSGQGYKIDNNTYQPSYIKTSEIYGGNTHYSTGSVRVFFQGVEIKYPYITSNNTGY